MPQASTRSKRSGSGSSKASSKKSGSASKSSRGSTSKNSSGSSSSRRSSSQPRARGSSSRSGRSSARSNQSRPVAAGIAEKAKGPALAGGAALAGLAGGIALTRARKPRDVLGRVGTPKLSNLSAPKLSLPKPGPALKSIGEAAGTVAERSRRLGEVASEVQKASEAIGSRSGKS